MAWNDPSLKIHLSRNVKELKMICSNSAIPENTIADVIPVNIKYNSAWRFCQNFGAEMYLPSSIEDIKALRRYNAHSLMNHPCNATSNKYIWLPVVKSKQNVSNWIKVLMSSTFCSTFPKSSHLSIEMLLIFP